MNFLAFDLGGSSGKLMLGVYKDGKISLEKIHQFQNKPVEVNGNLYWDILYIYRNLCDGIRKAVKITGDEISGMAFDSFCNDFALVSERGELVEMVYSYRDRRTERNRELFYKVMKPEELYEINGNQMALFNTLNQMHAIKAENRQWILEHAHKALFVSDYFIYLLTGKMVTEYTTASVTQMYDYRAKDWSEKILDKYGIDRNLFAPIVMPGILAGRTTGRFNSIVGSKGFNVYTVCQHDTASAFLASVSGAHSAIISTGTWCLVGMETGRPVIKPEGLRHNIANEGGFPGRHHRILKNVMGTWIIQEIMRELSDRGNRITYADLEKLAEENMRTDVFADVDDPDFYLPGNMLDRLGKHCSGFCGKSPRNPGEAVCCVYESLAFKYRMIIEELEELTGENLNQINMIGGGIQSRLMCRLTANICKRPVIAGPADASSMGNLLVQMLAAGAIGSIEEGRKIIADCTETRIYYPDHDQKWEILFEKFTHKIRGEES